MKHLFCLLIVPFFISGAFAQEIKIGPRAGLNVANQAGDFNGDNTSSVAGFRGGIGGSFSLTDAVALDMEILYNTYGSESLAEQDIFIVFGSVSTSVAAKNQLDYLTIPLTARINILENGPFQIFGKIGPYGSFLLNDQIDYSLSVEATSNNAGGSGGDTTLTQSLSDRYKTADLGLEAGLGFAYELGEGELTFNIAYNLGLLNIAKENLIVPSREMENLNSSLSGNSTGIWAIESEEQLKEYDPAYDASIRNLVFSFTVGYNFYLD